MKDKEQLLRELEDAIDRADMDAIERGLVGLSSVEPQPILGEDPRLFSARILKQHKENENMKASTKVWRVTAIAAAAALMGVAVYAAAEFQRFSLAGGDKFVTLQTNQDITQQEANQIMEEGLDHQVTPEERAAAAQAIQQNEQSFASVEEAAAQMNMVLPLPGAMGDMELESATGQSLYGEGVEDHTVWLNFADSKDRMVGVTVTRQIVTGTVTTTTTGDMDEGSLGTYKSKSGITYTTLTESDETGENTAFIAMATVGEYEYALVLDQGFTESERHALIDSVDLTACKK